jgi:hypothetical protein
LQPEPHPAAQPQPGPPVPRGTSTTVTFNGNTWTLGDRRPGANSVDRQVLKNGIQAENGFASALLVYDGTLYVYAINAGGWFKYLNPGWQGALPGDPRVTSARAPTAIHDPPTRAGAASLANLEEGFARNLGPYANPDPQFTDPDFPDSASNGTPNAANIVDYSGTVMDAKRKRIGLFGGGHGPSEETDIRFFDLHPASLNYLQWYSDYPSSPMKEMTLANLDLDKGRYISTNQPTARHTYKSMVVRGDRLYVTQPRGMPDPTKAMQAGPSRDNGCWGGRMPIYDLARKTWSYGRYGSNLVGPPNVPWYFTAPACLDPVSQKIVIAGPGPWAGAGNVYLYDPDSDTAHTGPAFDGPGEGALLHCPSNDLFYYFRADGNVWEIALDRTTFAASTVTRLTVTGTRPSVWRADINGIGMAYDSWNKRFGGSCHKGVFYEFDPLTHVWKTTRVQTEAGSTGVCHSDFHTTEFDPFSGCYIMLQGPYQAGQGMPATTWAFKPIASFDGTDSARKPGPARAATPTRGGVSSMTSYAATAAIAFDGGATARFALDGAASMGRFQGEFVKQDACLARDPKSPAWSVWFRLDADGTRDEVVVEYGRKLVADPDVSHGYTLTLKDRAGDTIKVQRVERHYRLCRWRWQSAPRPIVRKASDVYAKGWLPKFGTSGVFGGGPATTDYAWDGPFTVLPRSPHDPIWADGGDHDQIGLTTEAIASYLIFGNDDSLRTARADAEALGNAPLYYRNDDGTLPNFRAMNASGFRQGDHGGNVVNFPQLDPASHPGFEVAQSAHWYASHALAMLTEDPYILEALQMGVNRRVLESASPRIQSGLPGLLYPGEQRSFAWGIRDLVQCWATTPDTVPSWLLPKSYWQSLLDDNRAFAMRFVKSRARIHSLFRMWTRPGFCSAWESAWLSTVCGMAVVAGLADWRPVFDWSIGLQMAWATHPKWRRWLGGPYRCTPIKVDAMYDLWKWDAYTDTSIDAGTCTDWNDFFNFYAAGQNRTTRPKVVGSGYGTSDDSGHLLFPDKWPTDDSLMLPYYDPSTASDRQTHGYPSFLGHTRAALAMAAALDVRGARAAYDWAQEKIAQAYARWPDGSRQYGQARFSLEAA